MHSLAHGLQGPLGYADGAHAMVDAPWAEPPLGDFEAAALAEQHVAGRHPDIVVMDFSMAMRRVVVTEHVERTDDLDARRIQRYEDHRLLPVPLGRGIGLAHDDGYLAGGSHRARRPPLLPIDHILVAFTANLAGDIGRVG